MCRRDEWLSFWVTVVAIVLGFVLFDRESANRLIASFSWIDPKMFVSSVLLVLAVYTLVGVVHHIIHIRVD